MLCSAPRAFAQAPALDLPQLAALSKLQSDAIDERRAGVAALSSLGAEGMGRPGVAASGPDATDAIARQLGDLRRSEDTRTADGMTRLSLRGGSDADVIELLVRQTPDGVVEKALATVCLLHALTRVRTTPAVRQIVRVAFDAGGAFRPVVLRELRDLDDRATAALVETEGDPSPAVRTWAKDVLEALGKRTPGDAVQTTDDQVLVDVLGAFASVRDPEAVSVVLSFVNSDRTPVRRAAREATLAYGQDALGRLRTTYAALTGQRLPEDTDARAAALALFDTYDHHRLHDVYARLDEGLARQRAGDIDGAIADFDEVLARQPNLDRGAETVPALLAYARTIEGAERPRAFDLLRVALRLCPPGAVEGNQVRGEIRYLEGDELASLGIADTTPFEQALDLDPTNERARARLAQLRADTDTNRRREGKIAAAAGVTGLCLMALGLAGLRRWRRRGHVATA